MSPSFIFLLVWLDKSAYQRKYKNVITSLAAEAIHLAAEAIRLAVGGYTHSFTDNYTTPTKLFWFDLCCLLVWENYRMNCASVQSHLALQKVLKSRHWVHLVTNGRHTPENPFVASRC